MSVLLPRNPFYINIFSHPFNSSAIAMKLTPVLAVLGSLDAIRAQFSRESVVAASPQEGGTAQSRFGFFRDGTPYVRASDSAKAVVSLSLSNPPHLIHSTYTFTISSNSTHIH